MKQWINICILLATITTQAQFDYNDYVTGVITEGERLAAEEVLSESKKIAADHAKVAAVSALIKAGRSRLDAIGIIPIDVLAYRKHCGSYFFPHKKRRCNDQVNLLHEAYTIAYRLATVPTFYNMDIGVQEHVIEKYISIANTVEKELATIKRDAAKRSLLSKLTN